MEGLRLSIIVPVYNVEPYIRTCMESIFKQQLDEDCFEVIIVNDGTQDRSMEVIEDIIARHTNITVINQENQGLSVARNNGIAAAKGEYILMPDSDDLLIENSLKPLLDKAIETKADLVVADFLKMNDEEIEGIKNNPPQTIESPVFIEKNGSQLFMEDLMPNEYYVWRTLFRRLFLIENGITFYPGITFQDVPFTQECYLKADMCLQTHWKFNIYRRGHYSASSPETFNMKKVHDFSIAIAKTWQLRRIDGLTPQIITKLNDNIYTSFINLFGRIMYGLETFGMKVTALKILKNTVPDLKFTNNLPQKVHTLFLRLSPVIHVLYGEMMKYYFWN